MGIMARICDRCKDLSQNTIDLHGYEEGIPYTEQYDLCGGCAAEVKGYMTGRELKKSIDLPFKIGKKKKVAKGN